MRKNFGAKAYFYSNMDIKLILIILGMISRGIFSDKT